MSDDHGTERLNDHGITVAARNPAHVGDQPWSLGPIPSAFSPSSFAHAPHARESSWARGMTPHTGGLIRLSRHAS